MDMGAAATFAGVQEEVWTDAPSAAAQVGGGVVVFDVRDTAAGLPLYSVEGDTLVLYLHAGQRRAWESDKRWLLVLAGTQGGKTSFASPWLLKEMQAKGPGDYLFVSPTFNLLRFKALPEFRRLFCTQLGLGKLVEGNAPMFTMSPEGARRVFGDPAPGTQHEETRVIFGHASNPESLESATAKGAVLDEAGQKRFRLGSWEAIQRRLSIHQGRALIPTTPYTLGWLKDALHDQYGKDPDVELVQFESTMNPAFPPEEFERQRTKMPPWKFNMMYRGRFERPAGMIYDCFRRDVHCVPRFAIPDAWPRHLGLDFGGVNTAAVFLAHEPGTRRYVLYRTYHAGSRTAAEHARALLRGEPKQPAATGGARSEGQWRGEFGAAGLPVKVPPASDVEVGIDRVYALLKNHPGLAGQPEPSGERGPDGRPLLIRHDPARPHLEIMDDLSDLVDDLEAYSRELDENDEPTEKIEDKETWHRLDALRYKACEIAAPAPSRGRATGHVDDRYSY